MATRNASEGAPSLVSLFAGAGGLDLGLEEAGFTTLLANELEEHACRTLIENKRLPTLDRSRFHEWFEQEVRTQRCYLDWPEESVQALRLRLEQALEGPHWLREALISCCDIRELTSDSIRETIGIRPGELTLIAGGPPCQPFSRAGKRETVKVESGRLFLEFVRLVDGLRPRWFLFENVKGLLLHKTDIAHLECASCGRTVPPFEERDHFLRREGQSAPCPGCGKQGTVTVSSPPDGSLHLILAEFERLGYKCSWKVLNASDFGVPQIRHRLFVVGSRDAERFTWPQPTHQQPRGVNQPRQASLFSGVDEGAEFWVSAGSALWPQGHPVFGRLDAAVARLWVKNVVRPHAEPVTWPLDRPAPTVGAHQAAKLAIAPDGVPDEQLKRQQWHVKGRRQGDLPPVRVRHEYLSDGELLRLQTFPASWYLHGTRMQRAFQIGNAVPPRLAAAIGTSILQACGQAHRDAERIAIAG